MKATYIGTYFIINIVVIELVKAVRLFYPLMDSISLIVNILILYYSVKLLKLFRGGIIAKP